MKLSIINLLLYVIILFISSCGEKFESIHKEFVIANPKVLAEDVVIKDSIENFYFSRIYIHDKCGLQIIYKLPKEYQNKELWVVVRGRARTNYAHSNANISLNTRSIDGQMLCWKATRLRYYFTDINKWCHFKDSIFLTNSLFDKTHYTITTFAFLGNSGSELFDMDSLIIDIKQKI